MKFWIAIIGLLSISSSYAATKTIHGFEIPVLSRTVEVPDDYNPRLSVHDQIDGSIAAIKLTDIYFDLLTENNAREAGKQNRTRYSSLNDKDFQELLAIVEHDYSNKGVGQYPQLSNLSTDEGPLRSEAEKKRGYFFSYFQTGSAPAAQNAKELCNQFRSKTQNFLLNDVQNNLSFHNRGGILNKGVCWWHSSLTRAAAYLAIYKPNAPKPNLAQAREIINRLAKMDQIVEIPGYGSLSSFSSSFESEIVSKLESMQWGEVFGANMRGLDGEGANDSRAMRTQIERAYSDLTARREPVYVMLQTPGMKAHAWIIIDIKKNSDGYTLFVHDSNYSGVQVWRYRYGMKEFIYVDNTPFIPYVNSKEKGQLSVIQNTVEKFCRNNKM